MDDSFSISVASVRGGKPKRRPIIYSISHNSVFMLQLSLTCCRRIQTISAVLFEFGDRRDQKTPFEHPLAGGKYRRARIISALLILKAFIRIMG